MLFELSSKHKKSLLLLAGFLLLVGIFFLIKSKSSVQKTDDTAAVKGVIEDFGKTLKDVSLLSPSALFEIEENYKGFLAPALLEKWKNDPKSALGRLASDFWPGSIEIGNIQKISGKTYQVEGKIVNEANSGEIGTQAIIVILNKENGRWLISEIHTIPLTEDAWKTVSAKGIEFQYPEKLDAKYISTQEWPPVVSVKSGNYKCNVSPAKNSLTTIITERVLGGRIYCAEAKDEGAAGSTYSSYTYTTPRNGELVLIKFVLRYPNCGNYGAVENLACAKEQEAFDLDMIVDRIAQSVKFDLPKAKNDIYQKLSECMPRSDMEGYIMCQQLFKKIKTFDDCVMAGFSIEKTNPPECRVPDGRVLVEEIN